MSVTNETLSKHAVWAADDYFKAAIECIDKKFGNGYAKQNPQLIGSFMQAAALEFASSYIVKEIREEIGLRS